MLLLCELLKSVARLLASPDEISRAFSWMYSFHTFTDGMINLQPQIWTMITDITPTSLQPALQIPAWIMLLCLGFPERLKLLIIMF